MERYGLALLVEQPDGTVRVVGRLERSRREVLSTVLRLGRAVPADVAADIGAAGGDAHAACSTTSGPAGW